MKDEGRYQIGIPLASDGKTGDIVPFHYRGNDYLALKFPDGWKFISITNIDNLTIDTLGTIRLGSFPNNYIEHQSDGNTIFHGRASLQFGSCWGNEIGWTQAAAVQNTWYEISDADMSDGQLNGVTHDGSGKLTIADAGMYLCIYTLAGENDGGAGTHLEDTFSVSGTESNDGVNHTETREANAQIVIAGTAILDLADGATLEVSLRTTDAGAPDISIDHLNITILQIGGT
jgi:hypothetical protein